MATPTILDARLSSLIDHLYAAAMDPSLWPGTATLIAEAMQSTSAVVKLHTDGGEVSLLECTGNLVVSEADRAWAEDWHRRDLWVERSVQHGMGRVITDADLVTVEEQRCSGFYQEWLRHLDIHHLLGAVFPAGPGTVAVLGIHRPADAGGYRRHERRRAAFLLPHLQRALRLRQQLQAVSLQQGQALAALDRLDTGVFMVDAALRVRFMNGAAQQLLRHNTELSVVRDRLCLSSASLQQRLLVQLQAAVNADGAAASAAGSVLLVPRERRAPLSVEVVPLAPGHSAPAPDQRAALVQVRDPVASVRLAQLQALFGFTPTEAAVAASLAQGVSLETMAAQMQISLDTVRTHLKRILSKTGTHRQAEAAVLLARSAGLEPFP